MKNQGQSPEIKVKERSKSKGRIIEEKDPLSNDSKELKQKSLYVEEQSRSKSQAHSKKIDDIPLMQENELSN